MKTFSEYLEIIQEAKETKTYKIFIQPEGSQLMQIANFDGLQDYISKNKEYQFKINKNDKLYSQIKNMYAKSSQISKPNKDGYVTFMSNEKVSRIDGEEDAKFSSYLKKRKEEMNSEEDEM